MCSVSGLHLLVKVVEETAFCFPCIVTVRLTQKLAAPNHLISLNLTLWWVKKPDRVLLSSSVPCGDGLSSTLMAGTIAGVTGRLGSSGTILLGLASPEWWSHAGLLWWI